MNLKGEKKSGHIEDYYEPQSPKNDFSAPLVAKQSRKTSVDEAIAVTSGKGDRQNDPSSPMTRYRKAAAKQKNVFKGDSY